MSGISARLRNVPGEQEALIAMFTRERQADSMKPEELQRLEQLAKEKREREEREARGESIIARSMTVAEQQVLADKFYKEQLAKLEPTAEEKARSEARRARRAERDESRPRVQWAAGAAEAENEKLRRELESVKEELRGLLARLESL